MPYTRISATKELSPEVRQELVDGLGEAIGVIPGKDGRGLIVELEDGKTMYLGGAQQENLVFADVRYFSNFTYQVKKEFTKAVFAVLRKVLEARDDRMFLTITEFNSWGGFGGFKDEFYSD